MITDDLMKLVRAKTKSRPLLESLEALLVPEATWKALDTVESKGPVWTLPAENVVIQGTLRVDGNIVVRVARKDRGTLVVIGDVYCKNLSLSWEHSLVVLGNVHVEEVFTTDFEDAVTEVYGSVDTRLLISGGGAWLQHWGGGKVKAKAKAINTYYMDAKENDVEGKPADLRQVLDPDVLDTEEWDDLSSEERADEDPARLIKLDEKKSLQRLSKGRSLLLSSSKPRK